MSGNNKKLIKGGGNKTKYAETGSIKGRLQDCVLNTWRDLRTALEVGAAEGIHVTSIELVSKEPIKVNLKMNNPRTLVEEPLTDGNIKKFMAFELSDLSNERNRALARAARRAAAVPNNGGGDNNNVERSELFESSHDDDTVEIGDAVVEDAPDEDDVEDDESDILTNNEIYESSKALIINKYNEEAKALRKENQKLTLDRQGLLRSFHEVFVKEKNNSLYQCYTQKYGSITKQPSVIEYVKRILGI